MVGHVDATKHTMFRQACDTVKAQLERMCREVQRQMSDRTEAIFDAVFRDYMAVLGMDMQYSPTTVIYLHRVFCSWNHGRSSRQDFTAGTCYAHQREQFIAAR